MKQNGIGKSTYASRSRRRFDISRNSYIMGLFNPRKKKSRVDNS